MAALKFGFSEDVIAYNTQLLMDQGRSKEVAEGVARKHAEQSKRRLERVQEQRKKNTSEE